MEITFNSESSIKEIQQAFSEAYPFLRIEFFKTRHQPGKLFSKENRVPSSIKAGDLGKEIETASIRIDGTRTVTELEKECMEMTGLYVQVLRRSGGSWIQTSLTDDWSLERQNKEAELLTIPHAVKTWEQKLEDERFDAE